MNILKLSEIFIGLLTIAASFQKKSEIRKYENIRSNKNNALAKKQLEDASKAEVAPNKQSEPVSN